MKNILLLIVFILATCVLNAQTEKKVTWDYPVKPGMPEWQQFKSTDDMFKACQIPDNILKEIDTETLTQICFNFPAYLYLFFFNSPQAGFESFHSSFNGIRELLNRKDVGHFLLKKYTTMSLNDFNPLWTLEKQGEFSYKYQYFEIIIAQPQVIASLDDKDRILFVKEAIKKYDEKALKNEVFSGKALSINAWVMAKVLYKENKLSTNFAKQSDVELSLQSGQLIDYDLQSIYQQAKKYVNE